MSRLSKLLNKIKNTAPAEITEAIEDVRKYAGSPVTDAIATEAADRLEVLEGAILKAVNAYLVAKLGPAFGSMAALLANNAVHGVLDGIELALRGAAVRR